MPRSPRTESLHQRMLAYLEAALACSDETKDRAAAEHIEAAIQELRLRQWPALDTRWDIVMKRGVG
jgi:hypothetical protein